MQEELNSFRERAQRERSRIKQLEVELRSKEHVERDAEQLKEQLEAELRAAEQGVAIANKHSEEADTRTEEERAVRETLEEQIATLNEVNAALEQRCNALIRRVELSAGVIQDGHDLKLRLRDAEIDNETLVRTVRDATRVLRLARKLQLPHDVCALQMRELKDQHFRREKELKMEIEKALDGKRQMEAQVSELEADLASLRAQNSLFSEWMLVRNENSLIARTEHLEPPPYSARKSASALSPSHHCSPQNRSLHASSRSAVNVSGDRNGVPVGTTSANEIAAASLERGLYVHTSRAPHSPTKTRSMTTASPVKQVRRCDSNCNIALR